MRKYNHDEMLISSCANVIIHIEQLIRKTRCSITVSRLAYEDYMGSVPTMIETVDGLVFLGCSPDYPANAKIMKMDFSGNPVWENTLPGLLDNGSAEIDLPRSTSDGGFLDPVSRRQKAVGFHAGCGAGGL